MPNYEYSCSECGAVTELFRTMEKRHDPAFCVRCESPMHLQFVAPRALRTDTAFQRGINYNDGCRDDDTRRKLAENARRMGVSVSGKRYEGRFARFQGDPLACYGDRAEARKCCSRMGLGSEDLGIPQPADETTGKPYQVAEHLVERDAQAQIELEHGGQVTPAKRQKIKDEIRAAMQPQHKVRL